jgi:hypothetical protein
LSRGRARELLRIQRELERFYGLERAPNVTRFVRDGERGSREVVLVRELGAELEIALLLPPESHALGSGVRVDDLWLQAVEGVSHFLYIVERARVSLPATRLELELQAEVDKFAILADGSQHAGELPELHRRLYENVRYLHSARSEQGERYRLANDLAAKLWSSLIAQGQNDRTQLVLRRFYRASQAEKIRMVRAA